MEDEKSKKVSSWEETEKSPLKVSSWDDTEKKNEVSSVASANPASQPIKVSSKNGTLDYQWNDQAQTTELATGGQQGTGENLNPVTKTKQNPFEFVFDKQKQLHENLFNADLAQMDAQSVAVNPKVKQAGDLATQIQQLPADDKSRPELQAQLTALLQQPAEDGNEWEGGTNILKGKTVGDALAIYEQKVKEHNKSIEKAKIDHAEAADVTEQMRKAVGFTIDPKKGYKELGAADNFFNSMGQTLTHMGVGVQLLGADDAQRNAIYKQQLVEQQMFPTQPKEGFGTKVAGMAGSLVPYLAAGGIGGAAGGTVGSLLANTTIMATTGYSNAGLEAYGEKLQQTGDEAQALAAADAMAKKGSAIGAGQGLALGLIPGGNMPAGIKDFIIKTGQKSAVLGGIFAGSRYAENKLAQAQGLDRDEMSGVKETLVDGMLLGAMTDALHYFPARITPEVKNRYENIVAKYGFTQVNKAMNDAVVAGTVDPIAAKQTMEPIEKKAAAFNKMPDIPFEMQEKVLPQVEELNSLELQKEKSAEAFHPELDAKIEATNREIAEKTGAPLTEKETKEYEKLIEKRDAPAGEDGTKAKLLDSEKDKVKHYEKRLDKGEKIEAEKEVQEEKTQQVDFAKQEIEKGVLNWDGNRLSPRINLEGIEWKDIRKGEEDIKAGKDSAAARKLTEAINTAKEAGGYEYVEGSGKLTRTHWIPFDEPARVEEIRKEREQVDNEPISQEETEQLANEFDSLTPDEQAEIQDNGTDNSRESATNETLQTPPTTNEVSKTDTGDEGGTKKTLVTKRAYEGAIREGVKGKLESIGLTREVESQKEAKAKAKQFIEEVGEDIALDAVRNNDIEGAAAAYIWNEISDRTEKQLATEKDPVKIAELEQRQADLLEEWGKKQLSAGRFSSAHGDIYQNSDIAYNLQKKIADYKAANDGKIPAEVEARFREYDKQLKEVQTQLVEAEERAKLAEEKQAIENIKEEVARTKKKTYTARAKETADQFRKLKTKAITFKDANGNDIEYMRSGVGWNDLVELGAKAIEKSGVVADGVKAIIEQLESEKWYQGLSKADKDAVNKQVEGMMPDGETTSGKLKIPHSELRDLVERGVDTIEELTAALKESYPNATEREIRDAITGYGKTTNPNQEAVEVRLRKMKRIGRVISALEDIAEKKRPLKSGKQRDKLDAEERALNKELREAMKELPIDAATEEAQLKTALDATKSRLRNQIEDLQREIDTKEQVPKSSRTVKEDAELKELREQKDALKEEHDKVFKDDAFKEQQRLQLAKDRAEKKIEDLERRLKEKDFSKKKTTPVISDTELVKLNAEKLRIQEEYDKEFYKNELANRTRNEKIVAGLWEAWGLTRALRATGEFSFGLIQGGKLTTAHPKDAGKAFVTAMKHFASEKKSENFIREVKSQEWYPDMKKSGLAITEPNAKMTASEEQFFSGWTNVIWNTLGQPAKLAGKGAYEAFKKANPFKAVERAAVGYLDTMRILRYLEGKQLLEKQGKTFENSPQDYKDLADYINTMTGRASLGKLERVAELSTKIFFSPRNLMSNIKTSPLVLPFYLKSLTPTARKMAVSDMGKWIGFTTSMVALAAAKLNNDDDPETGVEFNPTSSDFMKIKMGGTRIDPWAGAQQAAVLTARQFYGSLKYADGKTYALGTPYKAKTRKDLLSQFFANKLSPSAALLDRAMSSKMLDGVRVDEYGKPYSPGKDLLENTYPIFWDTIKDLAKDGDYDAIDGLLTFYAFFGGGVSTYDSKKEKKKKKHH